MTAVDIPPFVLTSPSITIGATGTAVELKCNTNQIEHAIDQDTNDYDTFCGSYRVYGPARETLTLTVYQSFDDPDGLWNKLYPLQNTVQPFTLLPDSTKPIGPDNPEMSGTVRIPAIPFLNAAVNEASEIELEFAIQGAATYDTTVALSAEGANTSSTSSTEPEPVA